MGESPSGEHAFGRNNLKSLRTRVIVKIKIFKKKKERKKSYWELQLLIWPLNSVSGFCYSVFVFVETGHNSSALCELSSQPDSNSSKLLERNKERRKVVSALSELKECEEEDEEGSLEKDDDDTPQRTASSTFSSLSSFKHKFQRSFSSSLKTKVQAMNASSDSHFAK